mmetsp:Transcript_46229/g.112916  ORF Transcript_46229/g.112916 Transcript_46229/m.112916 type:complete len:107 (-) Transcript_46229:14-334(-)
MNGMKQADKSQAQVGHTKEEKKCFAFFVVVERHFNNSAPVSCTASTLAANFFNPSQFPIFSLQLDTVFFGGLGLAPFPLTPGLNFPNHFLVVLLAGLPSCFSAIVI